MSLPFKNKKGQFFSILLVVAVIGLLTYAYFEFNKKHAEFDFEIGEKQFELLDDYYIGEKASLYINLATKYSIYQALYDSGKKGGYVEEPVCGNYDGWILWAYLKESCFPEMSTVRVSVDGLTKENLNNYIDVKKKKAYTQSRTLANLGKIGNMKLFSSLKFIGPGSWIPVIDDDLADALEKELPESVGASGVKIEYGNEGESVTITKVTKYVPGEKNYDNRPNPIGAERTEIEWETDDGKKYTLVDLTPEEASEFVLDSYDFVFEEEEVKYVGASYDFFPLKQIKLEDLQSDNQVDGVVWTITDGVATINNGEYKVNINNGRWSGKAKRLSVKGIAAVPIVFESSCTTNGCSKYIIKPDTLNKVDYRLSLYEDVIEGAKEINETCATKERDEKVDVEDCVKEEVSNRGWYLGYCPLFSEKERECISKGKVSKLNNGKYEDCVDCYKECSKYPNKNYCERDPCNLGCEWALTSCVDILTDDEINCLDRSTEDKKYYPGSALLGIFGSGCTKCSNNKDCGDYSDERFCIMDPCDIGCYSVVDKEGKYKECAKCPGLFKCGEVYFTEEYCELDTCTGGRCDWTGSQCIGPSKPEEKQVIDEDRTFKICATDSRFFVYEDSLKKTKELPIGIRFALNIPDVTPPDPIERLDVKDKDIAEDKIILRWDKSDEEDISHYYVYYKEFEGVDEVVEKEEFIADIKKGMNRIRIEGRDESSWEEVVGLELDQVEEGKTASYNTDNGYIELETNVIYDVGDDLVYVLDAKLREEDDNKEEPGRYAYDNLLDGKSYFVAIIPVDIYGNENRDVDKVELIEVKDDLGPDVIQINNPSYSDMGLIGGVPMKKISLSWNEPTKNSDGSDIDDLKEYGIYKKEGMCVTIQNEIKGDIGALEEVKRTNDVGASVGNLELDFSKCYYFSIIGYDEEGNYYYGTDTVWKGMNIPGAS